MTIPSRSFARVLLAACVVSVISTGIARAADEPAAPASQPATQAAREPAPLVLGGETVVTVDVQYANTDEASAPFQKLNIYAPKEAKDLPVVIFVHGGGWTRGDRTLVGAQPKLFNDNGFVLVSVEYRLSPQFKHPAHVDDVAAAVAWVHTNIADYGGDPKRLFIMGHSAGSHLAALVATDPRPLAKVGLKPDVFRGAIMLDGSAYDIPDRIQKGAEKLAENCRRAFGEDSVAQADASPVNHIAANKGIAPFMLIYVKEGSLNHEQSKAVSEKLVASGVASQLTYVEGKTHSTLVDDLGTANNDTAGPAILNFCRSASAPK